MPCMGPSIDELKVKEAQEEILKLLADKYGVLDHPISPRQAMSKHFKEYREKVLADFNKAIREMFWQEACETF